MGIEYRNSNMYYWSGLKGQKKKEGISKYFRPLRMKDLSRLNKTLTVASIYFTTNDHNVCANDTLELDKLAKDIGYLLTNGFKLEVDAIGGADYRGGEGQNKKLGYKRALAVKSYLQSRVTTYILNLKSSAKHKQGCLKSVLFFESSVGETDARQPRKGIPISRELISKDRRVDVLVRNKDFKPPISIAVEGNFLEFNKDIERFEINNLGKVTVLESSQEATSTVEAQGYQLNKNIRERGIDYQMPTILIKITCSLSKQNDVNIGFVKCMAYNKTNNSLLFLAYAQTNKVGIKGLTVFVYTHPQSKGKDKVVRRVYKKRSDWCLANGYKEERKVISYNDFSDPYRQQFLFLLVDKIYNQLRGSFPNIKDRVGHMLGYQ
ncbi:MULTISPECIES: hypothetical protein [unclassified Saccharicrinis]|uniref:hypothetical protein n=1 Tax=unclassified Saccharicrinis TaxID=2646859 RepID=UPI003D330080